MTPRQALDGDLDAVIDTIARSFVDDPVWGVALARPDGRTDHHRGYWGFFVLGAQEWGGVWLVGDADAVAVWLPPGAAEMSDELTEGLLAFNERELGVAGARDMAELYDRFDATRPDVPHGYLSLLATHPARRGRGIGQQLLRSGIDRWTAQGVPTYLESSNPANDHRYARLGYRPIGSFTAVRDDAVVTAMWREADAQPVRPREH